MNSRHEVLSTLEGRHVIALSPIGGYQGFNTSAHRVQAMRSLGMRVTAIDSAIDGRHGTGILLHRARAWMFRHGAAMALNDPGRDQDRLLAAAGAAGAVDLIWLEKALTISGETISRLHDRCPAALIVGFSPDDMNARHNQSRNWLQALPQYDAFLTTKSYNVPELLALGCRRAEFVGNGYDPDAFKPMTPQSGDVAMFGGDVGFIGSYESDRADAMLAIARAGMSVRVWGNGWERMKVRSDRMQIEGRPLHGEEFARACGAFKINLGFLRKANRDQQTTRSVEIPACGGFMLAERTPEHRDLFLEGLEADFFDSTEELVAKCHYYLAHPAERARVAERGRQRCVSSGYSNANRLQSVLARLLGES